MNHLHAAYWCQGAALVEACLAKAVAADPADVPMPLVGADAALWHRAQAEAYRHALEMMAPPSDDTSDDLLARTIQSTARILADNSDPRGRGKLGKLIGDAADGREIRSHRSQGGPWDPYFVDDETKAALAGVEPAPAGGLVEELLATVIPDGEFEAFHADATARSKEIAAIGTSADAIDPVLDAFSALAEEEGDPDRCIGRRAMKVSGVTEIRLHGHDDEGFARDPILVVEVPTGTFEMGAFEDLAAVAIMQDRLARAPGKSVGWSDWDVLKAGTVVTVRPLG